MRLWPTSSLGKTSCWFALAFTAWLGLLFVLAPLDARDGIPTPLWIGQLLAGYAAGLAATIGALVAMVRRKDHALLLVACLLPGIIAVTVLASELLLPH